MLLNTHKKRFEKLGCKAGYENNEYYIIVMDDKGWTYSNTLKVFKDRISMLDCLYRLEELEKSQREL